MMLEQEIGARRVRFFSSVYCVESDSGVHVKGLNGYFDVAGKGTYQLMGWLLSAFSESRPLNEVMGSLPEKLRRHAISLMNAAIAHGLAREVSLQDECAPEIREKYPELVDTLDSIAASPSGAWAAIRSSKVGLIGWGSGYRAMDDVLPAYGFDIAADKKRFVDPGAGKQGYSEITTLWRSADCVLIALDERDFSADFMQELDGCDAARRVGLITQANGISYAAIFDGVSGRGLVLALKALYGRHRTKEALILPSPVAQMIAANHVCIKLFESVASDSVGINGYLFEVEDATLSVGMHQLFLPERLLEAPRRCMSSDESVEGLIRRNFGSSLTSEEDFQQLDEIAGCVAALVDRKYGPLLGIVDVSSARAPTPQVYVEVKLPEWTNSERLLVPALSMRECHNQGALAGIEYAVRRHLANTEEGTSLVALACGWTLAEAMRRASRTLALRAAKSGRVTEVGIAISWESSRELTFFCEATPFETRNISLYRTEHGSFVANLSKDAWIPDGVFGAGETIDSAVIDLLLRRSARIANNDIDPAIEIRPAVVHPSSSDEAVHLLQQSPGLRVHQLEVAAIRPYHTAFRNLQVVIVNQAH